MRTKEEERLYQLQRKAIQDGLWDYRRSLARSNFMGLVYGFLGLVISSRIFVFLQNNRLLNGVRDKTEREKRTEINREKQKIAYYKFIECQKTLPKAMITKKQRIKENKCSKLWRDTMIY